MSYRIYRTDAIVLRSYPYREADRTLVLYTEDFGLVYAHAQGIRHEKSKLRYALTDLSRAQVALVRGKAGWRVTGAVSILLPAADKASLLSLARIASLTTRLVQGEDQNPYLFNTLTSAHERLAKGEQAELIEVVSVSRMLHALGYIAPDTSDEPLFADRAYEPEALDRTRTMLPRLVRRINDTLAVTQL
jgi:DNA repair protein RecO (recombination protein O)